MDADAYNLFLAIGTCHGLLKKHATQLGERPGVKGVTHWLDLFNLGALGDLFPLREFGPQWEGFRLEEYVDAEFADGHSISWRLELTLSLDGLWVEADVRRIQDQDYEVIAEVADGAYPNATTWATDVLEIARRLCSIDPD